MAWDTLEYGMRGSPVEGLSRALTRALGATAACQSEQELFDYDVQRDVMIVQRRADLEVDGVCGAKTWSALADMRTKDDNQAIDLRAKWLIRGKPKKRTPEDEKRDRVVAAQNVYLAHRYQIPYRQVRPWPHFRDDGTISQADMERGTDCSGSTHATCEAGGMRDPSGLGYNGTGYTGSMRAYAERRGLFIRLSDGLRGDLTHYGGPQHVAQLREDADDDTPVPLVFSFGHYPCGIYRANYRSIERVQRVEP